MRLSCTVIVGGFAWHKKKRKKKKKVQPWSSAGLCVVSLDSPGKEGCAMFV